MARPVVGLVGAVALAAGPLVTQAGASEHPGSLMTTTEYAGAADPADDFPTPTPDTFDCSAAFAPNSECGTVALPLDYDEPAGDTTEVAYLRVAAEDQENKLGTLFLNPGGPGASGIGIAAAASSFLSPELLENFDVIGMDPRGGNLSSNVQCFENIGEQADALAGMNVAFPFTEDEKQAYVASSEAFGEGCSTTGTPLSEHASTANVARDMDVLRRVAGDEQLTYLGFSYGTYLGNVYANLFPDRVRAVAIDGVLAPEAWAGTPENQGTPVTERIKSGQGATKAIEEILRLCSKAGEEACMFGGLGDPEANYDKLVTELKENPLEITDPETGEDLLTLDYPTFIDSLLGILYAPTAPEIVDAELTSTYELLFEEAPEGSEEAARQDDIRAALATQYRNREDQAAAVKAKQAAQAKELGFGSPYDNEVEAFQTVLCTDSINPAAAGDWSEYADRADGVAPGFGPLWTWLSAPCAENTWTATDDDAYRGPFTAETDNPVLVIGNFWDPATNYDGAVAAAEQLPNSRLLSSTNFGHTAYGTSECVTGAIDTYLLTSEVPYAGLTCEGDYEPFAEAAPSLDTSTLGEIQAGIEADAESALPRGLPPVVAPIPGATPRS